MNAPSIARLESILGLTKSEAVKVRSSIRSTESGSRASRRIDALNLDGVYGVEFVQRGSNAKSPEFYYLNTGDTYSPTIVFVHTPKWGGGTYTCRLCSWGDIVERGNYE